MVQTAGNNAQLNETRGAERPPSSPISPAFFINFDVVTRGPLGEPGSDEQWAARAVRRRRFCGGGGRGGAGDRSRRPRHTSCVGRRLSPSHPFRPGASGRGVPGHVRRPQRHRTRRVLQFRAGGRNGALAAPGFLGQSRHRHHEDLGARRAPPNHGRPGAQGPVDSGQRCLPRSSGSRFSPAESHPQGPNDGRAGCGY